MKKPIVAPKTTPDKRFKSVSFLIISFLLHVFILLGSIVFNEVQLVDLAEKKKVDPSVQFLSLNDIDTDPNKIVDQDENEKASKNKPKDSKYHSKVDKQVEKETRAARHGDHQNANSKSAPETAASQAQQATAATAASAPPSSEANMKTFEHGDMAVPQGEKLKKAVTIGDLRPQNVANMASQVAVSQTPDSLKDVVIGAETHLNTKEFLYYTYFNRIKKKLRQHWEPIIHTKVRDMARKGRQIASNSGNKTTRLIITLDDRGMLNRVQLVTGSGVEDLDDAAVEALKESAPFPNPPEGLVVEGLVKINWDFILES